MASKRNNKIADRLKVILAAQKSDKHKTGRHQGTFLNAKTDNKTEVARG